MKPALLMLLLMGAYPAHAADPYKWRDQAGQLHYTDQPPPRDAQLIERPSIKGNLIEGDTLSFETRMLAQKYPVVLYVFDGCGALSPKAAHEGSSPTNTSVPKAALIFLPMSV